ncbi:MAG: AbrB/MazE/SpoVT family DNA-binding domain-containing protein [Desulfosoma sp.]|uniref:AbrB/MazE/SpoVT family DNA-binding domain-containing protein n=1 Tax=Desulfosoma sp. TaxID=2603217 RepID=UPI00404B1C1A
MMRVKLSSKGQIVIPKEVRERLNISSGTFFTIRLEKDDIVLTPVKTTPVDRLYGKFAEQSILDELEKEHAEEIARENRA